MSLHSKLPNKGNALAFLAATTLFAGLKEDQLANLIKRLNRRTFAQDVMLFHQDMPGNTLYILEEGCVRVFGMGLTGQEHTLNTFGPGDIFGELSVLDNKPRSASAITMLPTIVWLIPKLILEELIQEYPPVARAVIELLAARVRTAASHVEALIFQDVLGRLAYELLALADRHGEPASAGIRLTLPLTQAELASIVGTTRESINKALTALRNRKLVKMEGTQIDILEVNGLRQIVEERGR